MTIINQDNICLILYMLQLFFDLCQLKISAQDWNVILTANLAIAEYYANQAAMLA
ncbi:Uncharacterised protein [Vibrio cholerae]|nr:Uncharacterised protein [Vibrio cholerae]